MLFNDILNTEVSIKCWLIVDSFINMDSILSKYG